MKVHVGITNTLRGEQKKFKAEDGTEIVQDIPQTVSIEAALERGGSVVGDVQVLAPGSVGFFDLDPEQGEVIVVSVHVPA